MPVGPMGEPLPYPEDEMGEGMPPEGAPLPPEIMALLGGGGAPMPEQAAPPSGGEDPAALLDQIMAMLDELRASEDDPGDLLEIEKVSTLLQKIIADRAKEAQDAMQGKLSPRLMAQAYGG